MIYVIAKGYYSDYRVVAATTDEERAEVLKQLHTDDREDAEILEFEDGNSYLDESKARTSWYININKKGKEIEETCSACTIFDSDEDEVFSKGIPIFNGFPNGDFGFGTIVVNEPNKDKAMKIARERLAECKAKFFEV